MVKLEKIPLGWKVINEDDSFELVDTKGRVRSSITYSIEKDNSGKLFLEIISVASGTSQGKGYYGLLYSGLESFAKSQGIKYFSGVIAPENIRSLRVHNHLGFSEIGHVYHFHGREKRICVKKNLSI
jgi:predicted GNAT superfamily acetyltransferase